MTKQPKQLKPTMNGASVRLLRMREELEKNAEDLGLAVMDLDYARRAIVRIDVIRAAMDDLSSAFRNAETLARPENWRLMMSFDLEHARTFLDRVDLNILAMALGRCEPRVLDFLRDWLEVCEPKLVPDGGPEAVSEEETKE